MDFSCLIEPDLAEVGVGIGRRSTTVFITVIEVSHLGSKPHLQSSHSLFQ